jgi:steroid delta-isomerase-like uncharacterized protein
MSGTTGSSENRSAEAVVSDWFDAFARRDVEALMQLASDDIVEVLPGVGVITGLVEERAFLSGLFASFPDLETEVKRVTASGSVVAVEWARRGAFTGSPWQGLPPTGKSFESSGAAFMEVGDGRVTHVIVYSDSAQLAAALTPAPDPAS